MHGCQIRSKYPIVRVKWEKAPLMQGQLERSVTPMAVLGGSLLLLVPMP
jgi:hypothetical protein